MFSQITGGFARSWLALHTLYLLIPQPQFTATATLPLFGKPNARAFQIPYTFVAVMPPAGGTNKHIVEGVSRKTHAARWLAGSSGMSLDRLPSRLFSRLWRLLAYFLGNFHSALSR